LVARRAHNPKAVGSNPAPATKLQSTEISVLFLLYLKIFVYSAKTLICFAYLIYPSL